MNILLLNDPGTKLALTHPELQGKPLLGRGKFSTVYDNGDTVLHLTTDPISYALHCDGQMEIASKSKHFSQVVNDFGDVGEQYRGDLTLYLFETEKLVKLRGNIQQRRLALLVQSVHTDALDAHSKLKGFYRDTPVEWALNYMSTNELLEESIGDAITLLSDLARNYPHAGLDLHLANFMVRPADGTLVFNDPLADTEIYAEATNRLRRMAA